MNEKPTQSETLTAPEEDDFQQIASKEFVRPRNSFRGIDIVFSKSRRTLYYMGCDHTHDMMSYQAAAFIYVMINPRSEMEKLCWQGPEAVRTKVLDFMDTFANGEEEEALKIWKDELEREYATRVVGEPPANEGKKKAKQSSTRKRSIPANPALPEPKPNA